MVPELVIFLFQILEHVLNLTNGSDARCSVPISNRQVIIKTWVLCRLLTGQMLPKNLGHDDEVSTFDI